jgi:hypothetical protein
MGVNTGVGPAFQAGLAAALKGRPYPSFLGGDPSSQKPRGVIQKLSCHVPPGAMVCSSL